MTDSDDAVRAFTQALTEEDVSAAIEAHERLQAASIPDLLDRLRAATDEGRTDDIETLLDRLTRAYESKRTSENVDLGRVKAARRTPEVAIDRRRALTRVLRTAVQVKLYRSQALAGVTALVEDAETDAPDPATVGHSVEELARRERTFTRRLSESQTRTQETTVPPTVELVAVDTPDEPVPTGTDATLTATVANVGDGPVTGATGEFVLPSGLSADATSVDVGRIDADQRTFSTTVTGTTASSHSVEVRVTAENGGRATRTAVLVVEGGDGPSPQTGLARFDTDGDGRIDTQEILSAIVAYNAGDTVGGATVTTGDVVDLITAYNSETSV
jgi:hypothetical protein